MADLAKLSIHQVTLLQQCTTPQFIETMAHHDIRCASLWRDKVREHGVERTAALVADSGITMSGYCFGGLVTSPDAREAARARDDVRRALDEAAALGAPCLVFVAGGVDPAEKSIANARTRALDGIAELIPHARSVGVKLAIEPLHPMICATRSVLSTVGQANRWCDKLAADDIVGIAVDTYAVWWDPDLEAEIARAGKRICAFHVSDWLVDTQDLRFDRGMMGDGVIDIPKIRGWVEAAGYTGFVEAEIFSSKNWWKRDPDEVIAICQERFRTVC